MKNVTIICTAADKSSAQNKAVQLGDGPGTFSVPLSTTQGVTNRTLATHWGQSGSVDDAYAEAFDVSLQPLLKVFPLIGGQTFDDHLAMCVPRLYRIVEDI